MQILLVEDDRRFSDKITGRFPDLDWEIRRTKSEAEGRLEGEPPDFVICDLKIPARPEESRADTDHGLAVFDAVREQWPGVPVLILSGHGHLDFLDKRLEAAPNVAFRSRTEESLARHIKKDNVDEWVEDIEHFVSCLNKIRGIDISWPGLAPSGHGLDPHQYRLLKFFVLQRGSQSASARLLQGGQSGSKVVALEIHENSGVGVHLVAKIDLLDGAQAEVRAFTEHVKDRIGLAAAAPHSGSIFVGAGNWGAGFYRLINGFDDSLFGVLRQNPERAAEIVRQLRSETAQWIDAGEFRTTTVADIRRTLVSDEKLHRLQTAGRAPWVNPELEGIVIGRAGWARQHGDMHGENVLVKVKQPTLIDFGRSGPASAALDAVTLELSSILHPEAGVALGDWLTVDVAQHWPDLETFVRGCAIEPYLRACRSWAAETSGSDRALWANAYAYSLRQLQYDDVDVDIAGAVSASCARALTQSL